MSIKFILLFGLLAIAGCTNQAPVFSWYHPQGGEYLFAFDNSACEKSVTAQGRSLGVDTQGPYFQCMQDRGYSLITIDSGIPAFDAALVSEPQRDARLNPELSSK